MGWWCGGPGYGGSAGALPRRSRRPCAWAARSLTPPPTPTPLPPHRPQIGLTTERIRFRQHLQHEMAHYAEDCWDFEVECSYGWVECAGLADRSAYDLNVSALRIGEGRLPLASAPPTQHSPPRPRLDSTRPPAPRCPAGARGHVQG